MADNRYFILDILEIRAAVRAGEEHQRDPPPGGHEEEPGAGHRRDGGTHEGQLRVHLPQVQRILYSRRKKNKMQKKSQR